jgi:hypothetical protein
MGTTRANSYNTDYLQRLVDRGFIAESSHFMLEDEASYCVPSLIYSITDTNIFLEVFSDGTKELNKYNHYWFTKLYVYNNNTDNIISEYYYEYNEIMFEEVLDILKKLEKHDLINELIFNMDFFI